MGNNELPQRTVLALGFLLLLLYKDIIITVKLLKKPYVIVWIWGEVFLAFGSAISSLPFDCHQHLLCLSFHTCKKPKATAIWTESSETQDCCIRSGL